MKSIRKLICIFTIISILTMTACSKEAKTIDPSTTYSKEVTTPTQETETITEITKEETTTVTEEISEKITINTEGMPLSYLIENKDFILEHFNNKEFNCGDTFNCAEELTKLGYDINEYGNSYALVYYMLVSTFRKCNFEVLEADYDEITRMAIVNSEQNFILTNNTEKKFKTIVEFENTKITVKTVFLE